MRFYYLEASPIGKKTAMSLILLTLSLTSFCKGDLSFIYSRFENRVVYQGLEYDLEGYYTNSGDSTLNFLARYYLSVDSVLDSSDALLASETRSITANECIPINIQGVSIPDTLVPNDYYLLGIMDPNNELVEISEINNSFFSKVAVSERLEQDVDLIIQPLDTRYYLRKGSDTSSVYKLLNKGGESMIQKVKTEVYLSLDDSLDFDNDEKISDHNSFDFLLPGHETEVIWESQISDDNTEGEAYLFFVVNPDSTLHETDYSNNVTMVSLIIIDDTSEVSISNLKTTYVPKIGEEFRATGNLIQINNNDLLDVDFYLSLDTLIDDLDTLLDSEKIFRGNFSSDLTIPENIVAGQYFLLAHADPDSLVEEIDERNTFIVKLDIESFNAAEEDLYPKSWEIDNFEGMIYSDTRYSTSFRFVSVSESSEKIKDVSNGIFLSEDAVWDPSDSLLVETERISGISSNSKTSITEGGATLRFSLPASSVVGDYNLILVIDFKHDWDEIDEANNTMVIPFSLEKYEQNSQPDYALSCLNVADSVTNQSSIEYHLSNAGTASSAERIETKFFLSKDSIISVDDFLIRSDNSPNLLPLTTSSQTSFPRWSLNPSSGTWNLIAKADADNRAVESNETNNIIIKQIVVDGLEEGQGAELVFEDLNIDTSERIKPGSTISISTTIKNQGNLRTDSWFLASFYLSRDSAFDASDALSPIIPFFTPLSSGQSVERTNIDLQIPSDSTPGKYYLVAWLDSRQQSFELDKSNNFAIIPFEVESDVNTWNGTSWSTGQKPTPADSAVIAGNYYSSIEGTFASRALTVMSGDTLFLDAPGTHVLIEDTLLNNGTIDVSSGAGLVTRGGVSDGEYYFERITTFTKQQAKYSMIGSPIEQGNTSELGRIVYKYDETVPYDTTSGVEGLSRFIRIPEAGEAMTPGRGYFSAYTGTVMMKGKPNHGDIWYDLSHTNHSFLEADSSENNFEGFHVVANPYPAAINLRKFINGNAGNIMGTVWIWDDGGSNAGRRGNSDYLTINALGVSMGGSLRGGAWNSHIGSFQGFFVKADHTTSLGFADSMKVTGNNRSEAFFRTKSKYQTLKLNLSTDGKSQYETLIGFTADATAEVDDIYDAPLLNSGLKNQVFSSIDQVSYAIQAVGLDKPVVSVGVSLEKDGLYTLSLSDLNIDRTQTIYLTDHFTGERVVLNDSDFEFFGTEGVYKDRFTLQIGGNAALTDVQSLHSELQIFSADQTLFVKSEALTHLESIKIFRLTGQLVEELEQLDLPKHGYEHSVGLTGIYIVAVVSDDMVSIQKVKF